MGDELNLLLHADKLNGIEASDFLSEGSKCYDLINEDLSLTSETHTEYVPGSSTSCKYSKGHNTVTYRSASLSGLQEHVDLPSFLQAADSGRVEQVDQILARCPYLLNARDSDGYTALHRASHSGHVTTVSRLIEHGCNVRARTDDGWEPLHCAVRWNHTAIAHTLLRHGADVNALTNGSQSPLHLAAVSHEQAAILELLLRQRDVTTTTVNGAGDTPYDIAHRSGPHLKLFELADDCLNI